MIINSFRKNPPSAKVRASLRKTELEKVLDGEEDGFFNYNPYKRVDESLKNNKNMEALEQIRELEKKRQASKASMVESRKAKERQRTQ